MGEQAHTKQLRACSPNAAGQAPDVWSRFGADPLVWAKAAERCRDGGDLFSAAAILMQLRRFFPCSAYAWRELAILRASAGDSDGAIREFAIAVAADPSSFLTVAQAARHLSGCGQARRAEALLAAFRPAGPEEQSKLDILRELIAFTLQHPKEQALGILAGLGCEGGYLGAAAVERRVADALASGSPLCLIRLGDGEGAWISDPDEEGGRFRGLYEVNRRRSLVTWFGNDDLLYRPDFVRLRHRLLSAVEDATILGVPYPARIEHEFRIASPDGYPPCVNILRHVSAWPELRDAVFCTHDIHLDLQLSGALSRLVSGSRWVGLISCHPKLAAEFARRGHRVAASILVPEEKGSAGILGQTGVMNAHYPTAFASTLRQLGGRDWSQVLWLVAAGLLGKIYCDEIAKHGGVAVDVGSVADGWSGKLTRPGMTSHEPYRLWNSPDRPSEV